jgi:hypothetical protein
VARSVAVGSMDFGNAGNVGPAQVFRKRAELIICR